MSRSLYHLTEDHQKLMDIAESTDNDEIQRVIGEAFAELEGEIKQKIDGCAAIICEWQHHIDMAKDEAARLTAMAKTYENKIETLKGYMLRCMEATGDRKIEGDRFNVSIRAGRERCIVDEANVTPVFLIAQNPKVDKRKITEALNAGANLPFARLERVEETISIK